MDSTFERENTSDNVIFSFTIYSVMCTVCILIAPRFGSEYLQTNEALFLQSTLLGVGSSMLAISALVAALAAEAHIIIASVRTIIYSKLGLFFSARVSFL